MTKFKNPIFSLLLVSIFFTSCKAQTKTDTQNHNINEQKSFTNAQPKSLKLQAKNKTSSICFGIQDKSRNIWVASNGDGVHIFDGKGFTNYRVEDGLDNNIIYSILEDRKGNIWVGTKTGLNRYDPVSNSKNGKSFTSVQLSNTNIFSPNNSPEVSSPKQNGVWCMMEDKNGTIWFGTDDGVYCYNGDIFTRFLDNKDVVNNSSLQLTAIFSILQDSNGHIWFTACASEGISQFDGKNLTNIIPFKDIGRTDRVIEDKKGNLWFAAVFKGLCFYDRQQLTKNVFNEKINYGPSNVVEDNYGNIWFDTQEGLGFYDGKTLNILTEKDGTIIKDFIPVLLDKSGNLWFSNKGMKLFKYDGRAFINFSE